MALTTTQALRLQLLEDSVKDFIEDIPVAGNDDEKGLRIHLRAVARDFTQLRNRINVG